jgi:hypothetical protein
MAFEDHALGLPPGKASKFSVECDLSPTWTNLYNLGQVDSPAPSFSIYYALAHYHKLGTGMTVEAIKPDGTATTIYAVDQSIGDSLGQTIDPAFDMNGYSRIRFACDYTNGTDQTIGWGLGDAEMCVFLAFSDSTYLWGGGAINDGDQPGEAMLVDNVMTYSHACDIVTAQDSTH